MQHTLLSCSAQPLCSAGRRGQLYLQHTYYCHSRSAVQYITLLPHLQYTYYCQLHSTVQYITLLQHLQYTYYCQLCSTVQYITLLPHAMIFKESTVCVSFVLKFTPAVQCSMSQLQLGRRPGGGGGEKVAWVMGDGCDRVRVSPALQFFIAILLDKCHTSLTGTVLRRPAHHQITGWAHTHTMDHYGTAAGRKAGWGQGWGSGGWGIRGVARGGRVQGCRA